MSADTFMTLQTGIRKVESLLESHLKNFRKTGHALRAG